MNRKNKRAFYKNALLILFIGVVFYRIKTWNPNHSIYWSNSQLSSHDKIEDLVALKKSSPALVAPELSSSCEFLKKTYGDLRELKKGQKLILRFENIHKKIDQAIYRLRFFYKDGDEGEIENFLVYREDSSETPHIIEKSAYKKGPIYTKIEKAQGNILYRENGFNLNEDKSSNLFLHYSNDKIIGLQDAPQNIDCHFQQE